MDKLIMCIKQPSVKRGEKQREKGERGGGIQNLFLITFSLLMYRLPLQLTVDFPSRNQLLW